MAVALSVGGQQATRVSRKSWRELWALMSPRALRASPMVASDLWRLRIMPGFERSTATSRWVLPSLTLGVFVPH